jgi:glutaminyl-peptide cyclotransferase
MTQVEFGPRVPGSQGHLQCRDWIADEMKKHCENVRLQEFTHTWSKNGQKLTMWNVIGEQNWKDAKVRILLLAHWDTRPYADQERDASRAATPIVGANDGASGVAVLLELMRSTKDRLPKDVGVMYLMTDGEDLGPALDEMFLGAAFFAKNMPNPKPDYGILLDMVGDKDLEIPVERNSYAFAPDLIKAFYQHAKDIGLEKTFPYVQGQWIEDDHIPLNRAGLPTIDLIDFTYPYWHTLEDTPDKCSPASLGKVGKAMETWLLKNPPFRMPKQ